MPEPRRNVGLPYHLIYPSISLILLAIASFASADGVWYLQITTSTELVRFGGRDLRVFPSYQTCQPLISLIHSCGYTVINGDISSKLGCLNRGWQYQIPNDYLGYSIPTDISNNLSRVALTSVVAFVFVLIAAVQHAITIRYSFRVSPDSHVDKLFSLAQIHFILVTFIFIFTWIAFIAQAAVIVNAISKSTTRTITTDALTISWGPSPWLVLVAAILQTVWGFEAIRWRMALLKL